MKKTYIVVNVPSLAMQWVVRDVNRHGDAVDAYYFTQEDADEVAVALNRLEADRTRGTTA